MMQARVMRDGHCVFSATALNDVVVNRGATAGMVELRVEVDGRFVANQRADGLIIATPTGSTAYALSAGGPLLHPSIGGWILVPIAPHTLSNRPIVLSDQGEIAIEIVAGRDPSVNFDMQTFASLLHGDRIIVQSGGSTAGIKAALDGTADIGMSSRELHPAETTGLVQTVVARDGIAVIVHASNPVRALTLAQLRDVYSGRIRNWRELGGRAKSITVITREDGSGTRDAFEAFVMDADHEIASSALVTAYSGGLRKMVAQDPAAIGYVTFSQLNEHVAALAIDGVAPSEKSIASGVYRLQRPFVFLTSGPPRGATRAFIDFVLSPAGQQLARDAGLAPVKLQ
jgi:phosphate binding protein